MFHAIALRVPRSSQKNPAPLRELGSCPFVDARPTEAQRLLVLLRLDRGADPGQPYAQTDSQVSGSGS